MHSLYASQSMPTTVRLFKEDFKWLDKQGELIRFADEITFKGFRVAEGPPKKKPRKKRPPEFKF